MTETLLICGSRHEVTKPMFDIVKRCVHRAMDNDWMVIAGDAIGVDQHVAEIIRPMYIDMEGGCRIVLNIYGIQDSPRHQVIGEAINYTDVRKLVTEKTIVSETGRSARWIREPILKTISYTTRDQYMVNIADYVLAVWNEDSNGTLQVIRYAMKTGFTLESNLWVYGKDGQRIKDVERLV